MGNGIRKDRDLVHVEFQIPVRKNNQDNMAEQLKSSRPQKLELQHQLYNKILQDKESGEETQLSPKRLQSLFLRHNNDPEDTT